ncbi:endonuclease [Pseudoxanthomonas broegbernensis]|uniref:Endonuclease n=1 Tax=Pseudoxanthomonas broegbernensis TaxID=83619 RepID=A0A7V8GNE1_9GAMM|nr:ExeM/NucH family extracellular endonuclease [Pseudoxanthomonas broegbernensis]KAF1686952.1 endonuclease [Pseudoxanthomonas broegbernensis]MBB6065443.1 hypothetical protein [Pseudoxanthomonas broegbernensis]
MRHSPRPARSAAWIALLYAALPLAGAHAETATLAVGRVQGHGPSSPLQGRQVAVEGTVTADFRAGLGGFYLQDDGDGDPRTSDGVFVATGTDTGMPPPGFAIGARCRVRGRVAEPPSGGRGPTAIQATAIEACRPGAMPVPRPIDAPPEDWTALEGMLVRVQAPLTITGSHALERFGELAASFGGRLWQPGERARPGSAEHARLAADNAHRRLALDDGSQQRDPGPAAYLAGHPTPRVGTVAVGAEGIVAWRHGGWRLQLTAPLPLRPAPRPDPPRVSGTLKVAALNLENLFNGDGRGGGFPTARGARTAQALAAQMAKLVATIRALDPDIAALMELENDGYGPDSSIAQLVDALNADGARWRFVDAGHGPGPDSIRVGLIYRDERVAARGRPATLTGGPFGERSRVPLAQAFVRKGGRVPLVVVANHFKSKGCGEASGADADQGDGQGCWNALRLDSARRLHDWLRASPLGRGRARIVLLGDFNAYAMEDPLRWLREQGGWADAFAAAGVESPHSYVYDGLSGRLDHALLSPALAPALRGAAHWHVNADEPDDAGYAGRNVPGPWRSSDHDPLLLGLDM